MLRVPLLTDDNVVHCVVQSISNNELATAQDRLAQGVQNKDTRLAAEVLSTLTPTTSSAPVVNAGTFNNPMMDDDNGATTASFQVQIPEGVQVGGVFNVLKPNGDQVRCCFTGFSFWLFFVFSFSRCPDSRCRW